LPNTEAAVVVMLAAAAEATTVAAASIAKGAPTVAVTLTVEDASTKVAAIVAGRLERRTAWLGDLAGVWDAVTELNLGAVLVRKAIVYRAASGRRTESRRIFDRLLATANGIHSGAAAV
jgi:hypothetical protein